MLVSGECLCSFEPAGKLPELAELSCEGGVIADNLFWQQLEP